MSKPLNILIFPGGTENGLEIKRSLEYCKEFKVFSASSEHPNHAPFAYEKHFYLPSISEPDWVGCLNKIISAEKIDFLYPSNSIIISALDEVRELINCEIVMSSSDVIQITKSKSRTIDALKGNVPVPKIYYSPDDVNSWPVFLKPDIGYGSQGICMVDSYDELQAILCKKPELLIQEYLPGEEYTIDCFSSEYSELLFARARSRDRVRMGTSMRSTICASSRQERFQKIAAAILDCIPLTGAWFFQMKEDQKGELKLLEVDARIAGTMALNRVNGVNFPALSIWGKLNKSFKIFPLILTSQVDRCLQNRYKAEIEYQCVYIDLDHTIILNDRINTQIISFLFQCINEGKKLVLITKSLEENLYTYLEKYRILQVFDEIHWLKEGESKADYIKVKSSIFVDDSFSQRVEVSQRCGIPSLDPSMIELLIHERH